MSYLRTLCNKTNYKGYSRKSRQFPLFISEIQRQRRTRHKKIGTLSTCLLAHALWTLPYGLTARQHSVYSHTISGHKNQFHGENETMWILRNHTSIAKKMLRLSKKRAWIKKIARRYASRTQQIHEVGLSDWGWNWLATFKGARGWFEDAVMSWSTPFWDQQTVGMEMV